jgi:hypothetical protein
MSSEEICAVNLSGLSKEDQEAVKKQIKNVVRRAQSSTDISGSQDEVMAAVDEYAKILEVAAAQKKRNEYLNHRAKTRLYEYVTENFDGDELEGVISYLVGSQKDTAGARRTVALVQDTTISNYINTFGLLLEKEKLDTALKSGQFDREIFLARDAIDKGADVSGFSEISVKLANIINDINEMIRSDTNANGGVQGKLDGFTTSRTHNQRKILADMEGWKRFMYENLDFDRSLPDLDDAEIEKHLNGQVTEFSSGQHLQSRFGGEGQGKGLGGFSNVAKKESHNRVYHFKTPEAEYEYMLKFGDDNIYETMASSIYTRGRSVGLLKTLGPNPEANVSAAAEAIRQKMKDSPSNKKNSNNLEKFSKNFTKKVTNNIMPNLLGQTDVPGHHIAALVQDTVLTTIRTSKLGGAAMASISGDSFVHAFNVMRADDKLMSAFKGLGEYYKNLGYKPSSLEAREFAATYGIETNLFISSVGKLSRDAVTSSRYNKKLRTFENSFFKWTGQATLDSRARVGSVASFSGRLALRKDLDFASLDGAYANMMRNAGLDANDWDLMRRSVMDFRGNDVLDIEGIRSFSDEEISSYLSAKGISDTRFNRKKAIDDLIDTVRVMMQDQQNYSVLEPDARTQIMMKGTSSPGTAASFVRNSFWQFKGFPLSYAIRMIGREMRSKSSSKYKNMAAMFILSTTAGAQLLMMRDLVQGKDQREFDDDFFYAAVLAGGGLGIYGDTLSVFLEDTYGSTAFDKLAGPLFNDVIRPISKVPSLLSNGEYEKAGDQLARAATKNIPFQNHFVAKPMFDYLFMNELNELISPGSMQRREQRLMERTGQEYLRFKPTESIWQQ